MSNKLFVGNLPWSIDTQALEALFAPFGTITDAIVMTDRETGRSRGFGFVTFETDEEAAAAVTELNGKEVEGRELTVNVARPKTDRGSRF